MYIDPEADPGEVVDGLDATLARIADMRSQVATYKEYSELFNVDADDYSNLDMLEKEANSKHATWFALHDFLEKSNDWTQGAVLGADGKPRLEVEVVKLEVEDFVQRAYKMAKSNKEVCVCMMTRINLFLLLFYFSLFYFV